MSAISYQNYEKTFKQIGVLGKGNFSKIVQIIKKETKKSYALKVSQLASTYKLSLAINEVEAINSIDHPGAVTIHFYYIRLLASKSSPECYQLGIIMQKAQCSLHEQLQNRLKAKNNFTFTEINSMFLPLVGCLAKMQRKGLLHRDIKPKNILLFQRQPEIIVKLSDFGLAIKLHQFSENQIAGSYDYVSPKLKHKFKNQNKIPISGNNIKDDVFSFGITMTEICMLGQYCTKKEGIVKLTAMYGKQFGEMIKAMVITDEKLRPDFLCFQNYLYKSLKKSQQPNRIQETKEILHEKKNQVKQKSTIKKQKQKEYLIAEFSSCIVSVEVCEFEDDQIVFVVLQNYFGVVLGGKTYEVSNMPCKKNLTCTAVGQGIFWLGGVDGELYSFEIRFLVSKIKQNFQQSQIDCNQLKIQSFNTEFAISCLSLTQLSDTPLIGHHNGRITILDDNSTLHPHKDPITKIVYSRGYLYSSSIGGNLKGQVYPILPFHRNIVNFYNFDSGILDFSLKRMKDPVITVLTVQGLVYNLGLNFQLKTIRELMIKDLLFGKLLNQNNQQMITISNQGGAIIKINSEQEKLLKIKNAHSACYRIRGGLLVGCRDGKLIQIS